MGNLFQNKRIMITGATGLIGKVLVRKLIDEGGIVIAPVRNMNKAKILWDNEQRVSFFEISDSEIPMGKMEIDYIIHAAACTSSKAFVENPADIIRDNFKFTECMLEFARINNVSGFVYLSSMEVYGAPETDDKITELYGTNLNTMEVRSSYPESKRICEALCCAYASQYELPVKVIRLTQTFGPGVTYDDGRVFAEFARCVIENRDIILHTKGETKRSYLYTEDAADAIMKVLLLGKAGEAYNAANEDTYCSIYDMAVLVADRIANGEIKVCIEESGDVQARGFAPTLKMNLDTTKLKALGWEATTGLEDMFRYLIEDMMNTKSTMTEK